jgi:hypothetical protein
MSVFAKHHDPSKYFSYQRGKIITEKPWKRPTYDVIKEFLFEIQSTSNIMEDYDLYLLGGALWDFDKTWDVDIALIGNPTSYKVLEDYMHYMYDIALNKYNLLIDLMCSKTKPEDIIYTTDYVFSNDANDFLCIDYVKKTIGDEFEEENLSDRPNYTLCGDYLAKGNRKYKPMKELFIERVKNNPNNLTKTTFSVREFLEKDENYFLKNTNRSNV